MQADVVVVGGGLAGLTAACSAHDRGARVILVDRFSIGLGTNTGLSNAVFTCPMPTYSRKDYCRDTLDIGRGLNDPKRVQSVAENAEETFAFLQSLGLSLLSRDIGYTVKSARINRPRGAALATVLAQSVKARRIGVVTGLLVTDILTGDGRIKGITGINKEGDTVSIYAPAVVLATGGAGALYRQNDNQRNAMGQGYFLAARSGLALWDMEFVQFLPLVVTKPGMPMLPLFPPYPEETRLINTRGEDITAKHGIKDLEDAFRTRRDDFSLIMYEESLRGPVYVDMTRIPPKSWEQYPQSLLNHPKLGFKAGPVAVGPAAHFCMGGVETDDRGETSLPGLYACGEVAWGMHGANRRSGNALTECAVMGRLSGMHAADYARSNALRPGVPGNPVDLKNSAASHKALSLGRCRAVLRRYAWDYAGLVRSAEDIEKGIEAVKRWEEELQEIDPQDVSQYRLKWRLSAGAFVLKAILRASLGRRESRGSFNRTDFPNPDEKTGRKNSCLRFEVRTGNFSLSHHPVRGTDSRAL